MTMTYAAEENKDVKSLKPVKPPEVIDVQKVKKLDLNEKQKNLLILLLNYQRKNETAAEYSGC